ncbi:hypothetical protein C2E23DRAFT_857165 [Lenzites betulinus]|nr:hypothetical protein C2E23DRAFT_857165 [Lenzites betulinus]
MPQPMGKTANDILVKVRGMAPTHNPRNVAWKHIIWCDVVIAPPAPIAVGQRVVLKKVNGFDESPGAEEINWDDLETVDLDVEGEIVGIRTIEKEVVEFVVRNDKKRAMTELAYLTIENSPGETVILDGWDWLALKLITFLDGATRRMPAIRKRGEEGNRV